MPDAYYTLTQITTANYMMYQEAINCQKIRDFFSRTDLLSSDQGNVKSCKSSCKLYYLKF